MVRVFRFVLVFTLGLIAALAFERAWTHEPPPADYLPVDEAVTVVAPSFRDRFVLAPAADMCSARPAADLPVIRDVSRRVEHAILIIGVDQDSEGTRCPARPIHF
jgi:hypothetical protein